MRLLVLGGTAWLGSWIVRHAVERRHEVTALARGTSGDLPAGARLLRADRTTPGAFAAATGYWDAVIDVAQEPGQVRAAVDALAARTGHRVFVSTCSVYSEATRIGGDEEAPIFEPLTADEQSDPSDYGPAKVACERLVLDAVGAARSHVARVGLIGGPGDTSGRSVYWPWRFAHPSSDDGRVLVPAATHLTQVLDVRDLAAWLIEAAERGVAGIANVAGEALPLPDHLALAREVAGGKSVAAPADPAWLEAHDVRPWAGPRSLPLWLPDEAAGLGSHSTARAESLGLHRRPLAETLADALAWREAHPDVALRSGLSDAEEGALLAELG